MTKEAKRAEILAEIQNLQLWFAGASREANPAGWDSRAKRQDELNDELESPDDCSRSCPRAMSRGPHYTRTGTTR